MVGTDDVRWEEADFEEREAGWVVYELENGELVRLRTEVAKIEMGIDPSTGERITLENGEPLVRVKSTNHVEVEEPE